MIYFCACLEVGGKFGFINAGREACAEEYDHVQYSLALSPAVWACANVRSHIDIFRGMYTGLGTCQIPVRMIRSWGKIQVYQRMSRSMCTRVGACAILSCTLTRRVGMRKCAQAYGHIQRDVQ